MTSGESPYAEPTDASGQPLRNTAVVEAMRNVSINDTPDTRALLFRLLLDTSLLVVTPDRPDRPGTWTARQGETLNLVNLADAEGTVLPAFTSAGAIAMWRPEGAGYLALPAKALFEMAAANNTSKIVLDPGSPTSGYLTRYEIEQLARGRLPLGKTDVVAEATEVRIGKPTNPPPPEALQALRSQLERESSAERAWYFLMQQGDHPPELCIAIRFRDGVRAPDAMRRIIDGAGQGSEPVRNLAFLTADDDLQSSMTTGSGEEFYSSRASRPRKLWRRG